MENNEIINVQMTKEVFDTLGSGGNGGGNIEDVLEYYDIRNVPQEYHSLIVMTSLLAKGIGYTNSWMVNTSSSFMYQKLSPSFIAINTKVKISDDKGNFLTIEETFEMVGLPLSDLLTEENKITKEQFYDLNLPIE